MMEFVSQETKFIGVEEFSRILKLRRDNPHRGTGGSIWFTSGCFDLFHPGHLSFLTRAGRAAHTEGALLVVAVNSDVSIRSYKKREPIWDTYARKLMVANVSEVDYILQFDEPHPEHLVHLLQPQVVVHGHSEERPAFKCSKEDQIHGVQIVRLNLLGTWSTTDIIKASHQRPIHKEVP
jgi:D-beta-D-heptose 7-phosphate kinase/D-beta-D-heptose 1-phosphate adenosyltransferase